MDINVKLDAYNNKKDVELAEAKAYASLGVQVIKIKTSALAKIGVFAIRLGIKEVGHGKIIKGGGTAEDAVAEIDTIIKELRGKDAPCDPSIIVALLQAKLAFNRQVLDSGEMHLRADRTVNDDKKGNDLRVPFPSGSNVMIGISNQQTPPPPAQIEEANPKG